MNEYIEIYEDTYISLSEVILNRNKDIKLLRGFDYDIESNKRYMRHIVVAKGKKIILDNIADAMLFKEELGLFNFGDPQNKYFSLSSRTLDKESVYSLVLSLSDDEKVYITKSEAKAMVGLWNMAMQGYSFAKLLEFEEKYSLKNWRAALVENGYMN